MLPELYSDDRDGFIIIAHRGASAYYPENTMSAFKGAVELRAEMIELDVQLSKDGVPVIFHDARLNRHSNGRGALNKRTVEELKELDAGGWFDARFADERIPTLEEVLEFASGTISLNIEIKKEAVTETAEDGVEQRCLELVYNYGMENHVLFSSFDYRAIRHLKMLQRDIPVGLLYNREQSGDRLPSDLINEYGVDTFNCSFKELGSEWLRDIRVHGIPVFVYTVNQEGQMKELLSQKVSGIFTNKPDLLRKTVEG